MAKQKYLSRVRLSYSKDGFVIATKVKKRYFIKWFKE